MSFQPLPFFSKTHELLLKQIPFVTVTVVETKGSYPQNRGAKMIITAEGEGVAPLLGTIGGGNVEFSAIKLAKEMLQTSHCSTQQQLVTWNLGRDLKMACGGEVQLMFELYGCPQWKVALFGAGHVAQAVVSLLSTLEVEIFCFDERQEWLDKLSCYSRVRAIKSSPLSDGVSQLPENCFIISMTPGHRFDLEVLTAVYQRGPFPYVGAIGSRSKSNEIKKGLVEAGVEESKVAELFCPVGYPIGNNSPGEVAISIVAQLIAERDKLFGKNKKF